MFLYLFSIACSPMDKPGTPFKPLDVSSTSVSNTSSEESASDTEDASKIDDSEVGPSNGEGQDSTEEIDEEFRSKAEVIVNEEADSDASATSSTAEAADSEVIEVPLVEVSPNQEVVTKPSTNSMAKTMPETTDWGWPIRVVKTNMELTPPRAIIGLPDGSEIVVQSGHMLPEQNLVVMSIGERVVGFAKIHAQGDHARVETLELLSQN